MGSRGSGGRVCTARIDGKKGSESTFPATPIALQMHNANAKYTEKALESDIV